jgi:succinate dehydrogenase/fumarate reductase flavoprotein subunit
LALLAADGNAELNTAAMVQTLQATMADDVGPFRTKDKLMRALGTIAELTAALGDRPAGDGGRFDMQRIDWLDLRNMLLVARIVAQAALRRTESRGAHQREDFPGMLAAWQVNQVVRLRDGDVALTSVPVVAEVAAQ